VKKIVTMTEDITMRRLFTLVLLICAALPIPAKTAFAAIVLGNPQWDPDNVRFDIAVQLMDVPAEPGLIGVQGHISIDPSTPGFDFQSGVSTALGASQPAASFFTGVNPGEPLASYFSPVTFHTGDLFVLHLQRTDPTKTQLKLNTFVEFLDINDQSIPLTVQNNVVDFGHPVPEPTTWALVVTGLALLIGLRARHL
jgi:hypothetical protein